MHCYKNIIGCLLHTLLEETDPTNGVEIVVKFAEEFVTLVNLNNPTINQTNVPCVIREGGGSKCRWLPRFKALLVKLPLLLEATFIDFMAFCVWFELLVNKRFASLS